MLWAQLLIDIQPTVGPSVPLHTLPSCDDKATTASLSHCSQALLLPALFVDFKLLHLCILLLLLDALSHSLLHSLSAIDGNRGSLRHDHTIDVALRSASGLV